QATEGLAAKVNYPDVSNHSATTTDLSGCFISKWGAYPLVRHPWDECPYDSSELKVYRINDNPAASVHGFAVVDDVARWKVSSEHRTSHYRIDGSQGATGPWDELAPALPAGSGVHEVHLPGNAHSWYRLVEVETTGKEIVHGLASKAGARDRATAALDEQPSVEFLRERIHELKETRQAEMRQASADSDATPRRREYGSAVVFCPLDLQDEMEDGYVDFWESRGYTVRVETIESFPADPDAFRTHLKNRIASWEIAGARYFMLVGDANDWQWFDLNEQGAQYWVGDWLDIHAGYVAGGYPAEGQPGNDVIPTFVVPDTLSRGRNLAFMTPYWMTDQPYQDVDEDGVPDVVLARLPFSDESSVLAFCCKMQENQVGEYGAESVSFFVGDRDHDGVGDGQLARDTADSVEAELPGGVTVRHLYESDVPGDADRNDAAADHWNWYRPELLVMLSSYSNRSWPANFFDQTNYANQWNMGMIYPSGTHAALVIGGSCDAADFARTEDPDFGTPIAQKFLSAWDKGALEWVGPTLGSWQSGNRVLARYLVQELYADVSRPSAESFLVAVQRALADHGDQVDVANTVRSYVFLGDPLSRVNKNMVYVGVEDEPAPLEFGPLQNAPNPFNPVTRLSFGTTGRGPVVLSIFSVRGRLVRTLVKDVLPAGRHVAEWRGDNDDGQRVASGVYFCRLSAEGRTATCRTVLLK
ncbi:MAG: C25 family cysteine peptidase, partial [Candidatus Eisenbacteria bacterium]